MVDTGAGLVTVSRAFARRLKLEPSGAGNMIRLMLADGRSVEAERITLGSLRLGDAVAVNVPAVLLPEPRGRAWTACSG